MGLQFIFGNSGSGKSRYVNEKVIKESEEHPKANYLVIVPEQFTMQTQKELVHIQKNHSIMNVDILSFQRLAYRIFDELGIQNRLVLEDTGKNLVLRRIAEEKKNELKILKGNITKMGYISEMKSFISELMQYNITPEQLADAKQQLKSGSFTYKLEDILTVYQGFMDFIEKKYITAEEILQLLIHVAPDSAILKDSIVVLDGYTGFTPIQNQLLEEMMKLVKTMYVTVTIDSRENPYHCRGEHELFAMSKKMIYTLMKMAERTHLEVEEPYVCEDKSKGRFCNSQELYFLEQNLFRSRYQRMEMKDTQAIEIYSLLNPKEELDFIARKIERLVRTKGYRYKDMAVVCGDISVYGNYANEVFSVYHIPIFLDQKLNILFHPFIEFLRAVLAMIENRFSYESVFRYLRTGLSGIKTEDIDELENYVLAAGIKGYKKWSERFCYQPGGLDEEDLDRINQTRETLMEQFVDIYEGFQKTTATVREQSVLLYQFICGRKIEQQLKEKEMELEQAGDLKSSREYAQIYKIVMDLLDKMVELLGDEVVTKKEYAQILDAGLEAAKVGIIPPGYDRVVIGDMERTRLDDVKVLFLVGANDGNIPKAGGTDGIVSQMEREKLKEAEIELAPGVREKSFIQKYYLYMVLTKPSDALYISYARVSGDGKTLRKSYLIGMIRKLFDNLPIQEIEEEPLENFLITPESSMRILAEGLQKAEHWIGQKEEEKIKVWEALYRFMDSHKEYRMKVEELVKAANTKNTAQPIAAAVTKAMYGTVLENSVSRLERFAACAFSHFMIYGLRLRERELASFEAVDYGNIFHGVLEKYARKVQQGEYTWFNLPEEVSDTYLEDALSDTLEENHNLALYENARSSYTIVRIRRILQRTIWALKKQVQKGTFEPDSFEVSFHYAQDLDSVNFKLSEEEKLHLGGRIDRIDTLKKENQVYVKVIDYKTGNTTFSFLNIYYGLQLQLVVYMNAALEIIGKKNAGKEMVPAGMFYYHVKDPFIEKDEELSDEELREEILKELKLNGLVSEEKEIYENMDLNLKDAGSCKSDIIPIALNKDGTIKKTSKAVGRDVFENMSDYVNETIATIGKKILSGDVSVEPYELDHRSACDYCEFHAICQFDRRIPGYDYRHLGKLSEEEILEKMKKENHNSIKEQQEEE